MKDFLKEGVKKGVLISAGVVILLTVLGRIDWAAGFAASALLGLTNLFFLSSSIFKKRIIWFSLAKFFILSIILLLFLVVGLNPISLAGGFIIPPMGLAWEGIIRSRE